MRWVEENQDAENFFLWVDSFDPHEPWDPPQEYRDLYNPGYTGKEIINCAVGDPKDYLTDEELKHTQALYAAEVTLVDKWFGKFVEKVRELGLLENSLFVMVSDHGHPLGEHGIIHKHPSALYPTLMDCPMMIRHPSGEGAGTRINEFVYQHDLFTTMLNQLGVKPPEPVDSQDLWPLVTGKGGPKHEFVTCGIGRFVWVKDDNYAYIAETDGSHSRLFDLKNDPGNFNDIAADHPDICKEMHQKAEVDAGGPLPDFSYLTGYSAKAEFRTGQDQKKDKG
jgi:arylsulfatase A-like enzyme